MASRRRRNPPSLEVALRHELGLAPVEQLELAVATPTAHPVAAPPCGSCGRWNYHLVSCAENRP